MRVKGQILWTAMARRISTMRAISNKQKDRIREQDTFDSYRWPYQVATFTNPSGADERHSSYGFM
ncbi:MAG: hypothetical protein FIO04_06440 [Nitrosopumilales archaeon]|nr:hypothetical protein [Nitrosopumilales archaeon]